MRIMNENRFSLLFYLKKPEKYTVGPMPVYLRITVNGIPKELATGRHCDPDRWNSALGRGHGTREEIKSLNVYLESLEYKAHESRRKAVETDAVLTSALLKNMLTGHDEQQHLLIEVFEEQNKQVAALVGTEYARGTWIRYTTTKE